MQPVRLDRRAQILRRPVILDDDGEESGRRGDYAPAFTRWVNFRPQSVREAAQGGRAQNVETGTVTLRDGPQARTITVADRIVIQDRNFAIDGVGLPDRRTGTIALNVSSNLGGE